MKIISNLIDRIFSVIGALLFCQAPQFMSQYQSILSGHVAELSLQIKLLQQTAAVSGRSILEYISKFLSQPDQDFVKQGQWIQQIVERQETLSHSLEALQSANSWQKPLIFLKHFSYDLAKETVMDFTPGLAFNMEMLVYALAGIVLGLGVFMLIKKILGTIWSLLASPFKKSTKAADNIQETDLR